MKYDAITLGNHEFDYGPSLLVGMITGAKNNSDLPFNIPIVASNVYNKGTLQSLFDNETIAPYYIKTLSNGLKVAFIGILGTQAYLYAPMASPVTFKTYFDSNGNPDNSNIAELQSLIDDLRNNKGLIL